MVIRCEQRFQFFAECGIACAGLIEKTGTRGGRQFGGCLEESFDSFPVFSIRGGQAAILSRLFGGLLLLNGFAQNRIVGGSGFLACVFMNGHALVRKISVAAGGSEEGGGGENYVTSGGLLQREFEAAFLTACEITVNEICTGLACSTAGGGAELRERSGVLAVLRIELRLFGMDGGDGLFGSHFLRKEAGFAETRQGDGEDDQDDRDNDQEFDQGKAGVMPTPAAQKLGKHVL